MDKQGRITNREEWSVGVRVQWLKGGVRGDVFVCEERCDRFGHIKLRNEHTGRLISFYPEHWNKRFIVLPNPKVLLRELGERKEQPVVGGP